MTYTDKYGRFFGRRDESGNIAVLHVEDGAPATQLDANVYPVGSELSARHEHPEGIVLTPADAAGLMIDVECREMTDPQWYAFRAYNSQAIYGYGTEAEADQYAARLNRGKEINLYAAYGLGADDEVDAAHQDDGINLADELAAAGGEEG